MVTSPFKMWLCFCVALLGLLSDHSGLCQRSATLFDPESIPPPLSVAHGPQGGPLKSRSDLEWDLEDGCPSPYLRSGLGCYRLVTWRTTDFLSADEACADLGQGYLVEVDSDEEWTELRKLLKKFHSGCGRLDSPLVWTGGSLAEEIHVGDAKSTLKWKWRRTGREVEAEHWARGQPNVTSGEERLPVDVVIALDCEDDYAWTALPIHRGEEWRRYNYLCETRKVQTLLDIEPFVNETGTYNKLNLRDRKLNLLGGDVFRTRWGSRGPYDPAQGPAGFNVTAANGRLVSEFRFSYLDSRNGSEFRIGPEVMRTFRLSRQPTFRVSMACSDASGMNWTLSTRDEWTDVSRVLWHFLVEHVENQTCADVDRLQLLAFQEGVVECTGVRVERGGERILDIREVALRATVAFNASFSERGITLRDGDVVATEWYLWRPISDRELDWGINLWSRDGLIASSLRYSQLYQLHVAQMFRPFRWRFWRAKGKGLPFRYERSAVSVQAQCFDSRRLLWRVEEVQAGASRLQTYRQELAPGTACSDIQTFELDIPASKSLFCERFEVIGVD